MSKEKMRMDKSNKRFQGASKIKENNKGITLVALVITIIIIIILATVTIDFAFGDSGLIKQAELARDLTANSTEYESQAMSNLVAYMNEILDGTGNPPDTEETVKLVDVKGGEAFDKKTTVEDEEGNKIEVPAGFKIASDSGNTLQQAAYTEENPENYKNSKVIEELYDEYSGPHRDGVPNSIYGINATANDLGAWIDSVKENGGYYIGRYEASYAIGSNLENFKAATKVSTGYRTETDGSMSYTEGTLWNWITQLGASKAAINTYKDSESVKSDLMNSYAWDKQ